MGNGYQDLLNEATGQGSQSQVDQGYQALLDEATGKPPVTLASDQGEVAPTPETAPAPAPTPQGDLGPLYQELTGRTAPPPRGWQALGSGLWEGMQRNYHQLRAIPSELQAQYYALTGNPIEAMLASQAGQAEEDKAPQAQWSLRDLRSPTDFGYWLAERSGEQTLTILTTLAGGGGAALATGLLARALGGGLAATSMASKLGMYAGLFGTTTAMETAGTGSEQYQVTGSPQPGLAIPAGVAKGLLELVVPATILHALTTPGRQLGRTILGATLKTGAEEAVTEGLQEAIDVGARMYSDPNYHFFGSGPELFGEGAWRVLESTVAGGALGLGFGFPAAHVEARQEAKAPVGGLKPGEQQQVQAGVPPEGRPGGAPVTPTPEATPAPTEPLVNQPPQVGKPSAPVVSIVPQAPSTDTTTEEGLQNRIRTLERALNHAPDLESPSAVAIREKIAQYKQELAQKTAERQLKEAGPQAQQPGTQVQPGYVPQAPANENVPGGNQPPPQQRQMLRRQPAGMVEVYRGDQTGFAGLDVTKKGVNEPGLFFTSSLPEADKYAKGMQKGGEVGYSQGNIRRTVLDTSNILPVEFTPPEKGSAAATMRQKAEDAKRQGFSGISVNLPGGRKQYVVWDQKAISEVTPSQQLATMQPRMFPGVQEGKLGKPANIGQIIRTARDMLKRPKPQLPADVGLAGPVTRLRELSQRGEATDVGPVESTIPIPVMDPLHVTPLLRSSGVAENALEYYLDWMEARTRRYVLMMNGLFSNLVMNSTDLERATVNYPQSFKPDVWEVNQNSLSPINITAELLDLPDVFSKRVWFLPGTSVQEQSDLLAAYNGLRVGVEAMRVPMLQSAQHMEDTIALYKPAYDDLLSRGLRVVPSRGASFYYGDGKFDAVPTTLQETKRSRHYALLANNGSLLLGEHLLTTDPALTFRNAIAVSIDYNKFKPGEISALPQRLENGDLYYVRFENVSLDKSLELRRELEDLVPDKNAWTSIAIDEFRAFLKKNNTWIDPIRSRDMVQLDSIITMEKIPVEKLVPGVELRGIKHENDVYSKVWLKNATLTGSVNPYVAVESSVGGNINAVAMERELNKLLPLIQSIMNKLGLRSPNFRIMDMSDLQVITFAAYDPRSGEIQLNATNKSWWNPWPDPASEAFPLKLYNTVMHELGHAVTMHYFNLLSTEVQQQILYAYNKALLAARYIPIQAQARLVDVGLPSTAGNMQYYSGFLEWLAEQFRRFAYSDTEVRSELDGVYRDIAVKMENYYEKFSEVLPTVDKVNYAEPDYFFSGLMQYLRDYAKTKKQIEQIERQQNLYAIDTQVYASPQLTNIMKVLLDAMQSMQAMFPANHPFNIVFNKELDTNLAPVEDRGSLGRVVYSQKLMLNRALMEIAVGVLEDRITIPEAKELFAHELLHVYRFLNLITKQELNILYTAAIKDGKTLSSADKYQYRRMSERLGKQFGWDSIQVEAHYQDVLREETVAYYVGEFARSGYTGMADKTLLERILEFGKRIANALMQNGFKSRDDVLESFFRGEMASRPAQGQKENLGTQRFMKTLFEPSDIHWDYVKQVDERYEARVEVNKSEDGSPFFATYQYFDKQLGKIVGQQEINISPERGFSVHMQYSDAPGMALRWVSFVSKDLGLPLLAPPMFTLSGMRAASRVFPELNKYYVKANIDGIEHYYSPKYIREQYERWSTMEKAIKERRAQGFPVNAQQARLVRDRMRILKKGLAKIPKDLWTTNKHLLDKLFQLTDNYHRDEVQGSMLRNSVNADNQQAVDLIGVSEPEVSTKLDNAEQVVQEERSLSEMTAAEKLGGVYEQVAGAEPVSRDMKRIRAWMSQGYYTDPRYTSHLKTMGHDRLVSQEADRIGRFSKIYWTIRQLIWRNEHLEGLQVYGQRVEQFHSLITSWHKEADDVAKLWEKRLREPKLREKFANFIYNWLAEMAYLSPAERAAGTVRHPSRVELEAELKKQGLDKPEIASVGSGTGLLFQLYQPPWMIGVSPRDSIFGRFLTAVEQVSKDNIRATISDPILQMNAIIKVQQEMDELRAKPYFPISRFGEHSITVRDADPAHNNRVLYFSTFADPLERDRALETVAKQYPFDHIHKGRVPEEFIEFMGLPGPLIQQIRAEMPNLDATQIAWLEELERNNLPDKAFRARWKPKIGTPGYSMDAFRSFAHYFMHGSRYLARMQFRKPMLQSIKVVEDTIPGLANGSKRRMIVDYMKKHYNYIMEGGRDYAKFKALVALWQLGYSPAAAFMNLTQTPMVSLPWLQGTFGFSKGQLSKSIFAVRGLRKGRVVSKYGDYALARQEMIKQGRIDIGQAAELGAFAEGHNLLGLLSGTKAQKAYREFTWYGMWMFQRAEQANREIMLHAVWELGHQQFATNKRISDIQRHYDVEIRELQSRTRMSYEDATVFVLAKEALDQTQGLYAPYARPPFMRKPVAGTVLIFYQFMQMMSYAFVYSPGNMRMWLMMAFVYGAMGLPGAEDAKELLRVLSHVFKRVTGLGGDLDLERSARKMVRDISRGTVFDEVGPDLFLHGISRYGFGLGLLPDGYGVGHFDASANGSMGRLIPGLYEMLHGIATAADNNRIVSDVAQRAAGAGFGWFFNLAQFASESPGTVDSHRWEQMLPRTIRAMAAALRYLPENYNPYQLQTYLGLSPSVGAATVSSGARVVQFNATDPEDVAAIVSQALGFRPTRVSEAMDLRRMENDMESIYKARRTTLMVQMFTALQAGHQSTVETVMGAIGRFNDEVAADGMPSLGISTQQLRQSMKARTRQQMLQENFIPNQKMFRGPASDLQQLFPGVRVQRVR